MRGSIPLFVCCLFALVSTDVTLAQDGIFSKQRRNSNQKADAVQTNPATEIEVTFPADAETPVLVMDVVGGFRMKVPDGFEPSPMLQIFSDGRILTGSKSNMVKEVEGQMDLVELKSLMVFIVEDCHFFEVSSESIKADLEKKRPVQIMDAGTTKFEVNLKNDSNSVDVYAMPLVAGRFSDLASVASMIAISSRCRRLVAKTRLGSNQEAEAALASVNDSLAEKSPNAPKFTLKNLQFAEQFVDERRTATFVQNFSDGNKTMMAYATFQVDVEGKDSVVVDVIEKKQGHGKR